MNAVKTNSGAELFKGVLLAHLIIGLHVVVIGLVGLLVIFFGGLARYWAWILAGGLAAGGLVAVLVFRRARAGGRAMARELRGTPVPAGGSMEISFMGGLATVTFSRPNAGSALPPPAVPPLIEDSEAQRIRELAQLAQMLEKELITTDEFKRAKAAILNPPCRPGFGPGSLEN